MITTMTYAQDKHRPEVHLEIKQWLATPVSGDRSGKWALFDGAIVGAVQTERLCRQMRPQFVHNIFSGTEFSPYGTCAPHLVRLDDGVLASNFVRDLIESSRQLPAIAFLDAVVSFERLRAQLIRLADIQTEDGLDLYCRFADTRVTCGVVGVLDHAQRATLLQDIGRWQVLNRRGVLETVLQGGDLIESNGEENESAPSKLVLSDMQFVAIMQGAEPDEIFQMLCDGAPDLVPDSDHSGFHRRIYLLTSAARRCGLAALADIYQFCVIALATNDNFFELPALNNSWQEIRKNSASFPQIVERWSDELWDALGGDNSSENPTDGGIS